MENRKNSVSLYIKNEAKRKTWTIKGQTVGGMNLFAKDEFSKLENDEHNLDGITNKNCNQATNRVMDLAGNKR